jgi:hypothetical protein
MYVILGYPQQMPPKYEKWILMLPGNDVTTIEEHISKFWDLFQLNPISDDVEDLVMKLLSATLTNVARRWYDTLPDKSINNMDQLKETFLKRCSTK